MKKQTAIDWLIEELVKMDRQLDGRRKSEDATVLKMNPSKVLEKAKEMEKQQIMDARLNGFMISGEGYNGEYPYEGQDKNIISTEIDNEQYYNQTFNTEK